MKSKSMLDLMAWLVLLCQLFVGGAVMFTASAIPLHWATDGQPDRFAPAWHVVWLMIIAVGLFGLLSWIEARPHRNTMPAGRAGSRALTLMATLMAWLKLLVMGMMLYITVEAYRGSSFSFIIPAVLLGVLVVVFVVYVIRLSRT